MAPPITITITIIVTFILLTQNLLFLHALTTTTINHRTIIVGKIIIDEYGNPSDSKTPKISIGGGGPQAAWGAAAALATVTTPTSKKITTPPPPQAVTFLAPVGHDWNDNDTHALNTVLSPALDTTPVLLPSDRFLTPRIRLWHNENQIVQWYAVDDSFGEGGADGLWRGCPSRDDVLEVLEGDDKRGARGGGGAVLHVVLEAGEGAAGGGEDVRFLRDLLSSEDATGSLRFIGVEPVAFPEGEIGKVSSLDARRCVQRLTGLGLRERSRVVDAISPDEHLAAGLKGVGVDIASLAARVAVREGPRGSTVSADGCVRGRRIPAAWLVTVDGEPVNPTGAGNAYAAAFTALSGAGVGLEEAACVATGVGAVVCEWENLPPWTAEVIGRIREAAEEVRGKFKEGEFRVI